VAGASGKATCFTFACPTFNSCRCPTSPYGCPGPTLSCVSC
jgi:hypothetical protein